MSETVKRNGLENSIINSFENDYIQGSLRSQDSQLENPSLLNRTNWNKHRKSIQDHKNIIVHKTKDDRIHENHSFSTNTDFSILVW